MKKIFLILSVAVVITGVRGRKTSPKTNICAMNSLGQGLLISLPKK